MIISNAVSFYLAHCCVSKFLIQKNQFQFYFTSNKILHYHLSFAKEFQAFIIPPFHLRISISSILSSHTELLFVITVFNCSSENMLLYNKNSCNEDCLKKKKYIYIRRDYYYTDSSGSWFVSQRGLKREQATRRLNQCNPPPSSVTGFYDDYPATKCDYWTVSTG